MCILAARTSLSCTPEKKGFSAFLGVDFFLVFYWSFVELSLSSYLVISSDSLQKLCMFIIENLESSGKLEEGNKNVLLGQAKKY